MSGEVVLLGHQIGYSASPAMQDAAFAATGLDWRYTLRDVQPDALSGAVAELRGPDRHGANVTIPHKLAVPALLDVLEPLAARLGAVNTIVRDGDKLAGHNTDMPALAAELGELLGELLAEREASVTRAIVLGAGGAARAALSALTDAGVPDVTLVGRDRWDEMPALLAQAQLLVNATPVGTASDCTPVPAELLRSDLAVFDLVYRPSPTRLVRDALGAGAQARGGAGMLLRQAAASFELWTGKPAPVDVMREALGAELHGSPYA
ncbi:MAG: shikimate dehydrogenase [Chloroflexota bacterium]